MNKPTLLDFVIKNYSFASDYLEGLLYSKSSGGLIYYGERFTLWHRNTREDIFIISLSTNNPIIYG
jgi:hypothetical protein